MDSNASRMEASASRLEGIAGIASRMHSKY